MACEACEHCHAPMRKYDSILREGFSYHKECLKCYVCDETNLQDCEVFKGVIFCSSCSKRIFQGCSTARQNKHNLKRASRSRSRPRRRRTKSRPRNSKSPQREGGVIHLARMQSSDNSSYRRYRARRLEITDSTIRDTSDSMSYGKKGKYDSPDRMKKHSKEIGMTTEFTQQLLKEMNCPVVEMKTLLPCSVSNFIKMAKDAPLGKPRKRSPQIDEKTKGTGWSDMRIAELGASTEIANMALRKMSMETELPVIKSDEKKKSDSCRHSTVTEVSGTGLEDWLDSTYRSHNSPTVRSGNRLQLLDRPVRSFMRMPFRYFKKHILDRSSLVNVLLTGDNNTRDINVVKRLRMIFKEEITDHHRRGIKRLYSTINRRTNRYQLGWLHLDISSPMESRYNDSHKIRYKCKHFRYSHSYRCLRSHVMRLAGPTKSDLAIFRNKIKAILEFPFALKNILLSNQQAITQSEACGKSLPFTKSASSSSRSNVLSLSP